MVMLAECIPIIPPARAVVHDRVDHSVQECIPFLREGRLAAGRRREELDGEECIAPRKCSRIRRHFVDGRAGSTIKIERQPPALDIVE